MPLQAVETRRLYLQIADQIRGLIDSGEVARGARLPAERNLAKQLKVSRPSLREALIALEIEGLLDVRVGSGIYVTQPGAHLNGSELADAHGPFEVIRARRLIEGECAALAASNATPAQLRAIKESHARMVEETRRNPNPLEADRAFHVRLAEASGNSALVLMVQTLWAQRVGPLYRALERKLDAPALVAGTLAEHQAIVDAVANGDARMARAAAQRHMDRTSKRCSKEWKKP
jgi:DNA-binding FadR family transcriptional regulator